MVQLLHTSTPLQLHLKRLQLLVKMRLVPAHLIHRHKSAAPATGTTSLTLQLLHLLVRHRVRVRAVFVRRGRQVHALVHAANTHHALRPRRDVYGRVPRVRRQGHLVDVGVVLAVRVEHGRGRIGVSTVRLVLRKRVARRVSDVFVLRGAETRVGQRRLGAG